MIAGAFAALVVIWRLFMPTMSIPAGGAPQDPLYDKDHQLILGGWFLMAQSPMLVVLQRTVRRHHRATPDSPVTRALVLTAVTLGSVAAPVMLVEAVQVIEPGFGSILL